MNNELLIKRMKTYVLSSFTPQPATPHLRNTVKMIDVRRSGRECVETLTEYLLLNGIPAGNRACPFDGF